MAAARSSDHLLKSKFRGCLLGTLLGDCLGAPFEGEPGSLSLVQRYFEKLDGPYQRLPQKTYTDDTAMAKSVAKCLIDKPPLDVKYLANLFVSEYYKDPRRGYGQNVVDVFHKLRSSRFEDVYRPAREQFDGSGSYGNGGAMRIAPVPLFFNNDYKAMIEAAIKVTELTHTHKVGVYGALLQCIAIHQSLALGPNEKVDHVIYTKKLIEKMKALETEEFNHNYLENDVPYQTQLEQVARFLSLEETGIIIDNNDVVDVLGNGIAAYRSVSTGIYCYLRAQRPIPGIDTTSPFRRTIQYAISLGGDTDTIAAMAGSIAGAHYGEGAIAETLRKHCEFVGDMIEIADQLYTVTPTNS